jgi:outer membrane receptor protein involved in Fe transport
MPPELQYIEDALLAAPAVPKKPRAADWDPGFDFSKKSDFYFLSLRSEIELTSDVSLTSITSFSKFVGDEPLDSDGTAFNNFRLNSQPTLLKSFGQEFRVAGVAGAVRWVVGANYQDQVANQTIIDEMSSSHNSVFGIVFTKTALIVNQSPETKAVFGNLEWNASETLTFQAGGRYTDQKRPFNGCLADAGAGAIGVRAGIPFALLSEALSGTPTTIPEGGCMTLGDDFKPTLVESSLDEDNFSWRLVADWHPTPDTLIYASATKGYKSGSYSFVPALAASQYTPAKQESLMAFEVGFKQELANRKVNLSGALYTYSYRDKQLIGNAIFPVFGSLPVLINIPKSSAYGGEFMIDARPVDGLTFRGGIAYNHTKVKRDPIAPIQAYDPFGNPTSYIGEPFPNSPEWQASSDAEYDFPLSDNLRGFFGGTLSYRSGAYAVFGQSADFKIPAYALLDLRVGIDSADGNWRLTLWGRNVTNKYHLNGVTLFVDTLNRLAGPPATYGISLSYKM